MMGHQLYILSGLVCCFCIQIQPGYMSPTRTLDNILTKVNLISGEHEHIMKVLQEITDSKLDDKTDTRQQCGEPGKLTEDIAETLKYLKDKLDMADGKGMLEGSGATYVRWGRTDCPAINGTVKVYDGFAGGDWYTHGGGPSELLCLPREPIWGSYNDAYLGNVFVYGAEYKTGRIQSQLLFGKPLDNQNVPCVVCQTKGRIVALKVPGRTKCYHGWTQEYNGYLMGGHHKHAKSTDYTCVGSDPEVVQGNAHNQNGHLLYFVEANCGEHSLPCPPYVHGREMPCVICTK